MIEIQEYINKLIYVMDQNRVRHGLIWKKVRRDRIYNLFPDVSQEIIEQILKSAIEENKIESCNILVDKELIPAIKLVKWTYRK